MDISLEEFHQDFMQRIFSDASGRGLLRPQAFYENVCEDLLEAGDLSNNYTIAEYIKNNIQICGYDYDEERELLTLLGHRFYQHDEMQTVLMSDIQTSFRNLRNYLSKCNDPHFYKEMEETQPAFSMTYQITNHLNSGKIKKFRFLLLTDGKATKTLTHLESELIFGIEIEFRVIDINYLYHLFKSQNSGGDYETEVDLPCLKIINNDKYQSYLAVINGNELVSIYEKFGQKLFEQNVRTFLQFRGAVNKGLRNTIQYSPEMFFAYNNGITATATELEINEDNHIKKITNLQIVNGGQTTSSIYAASRNGKLDVSGIYVQMKLSVVKENDQLHDFVSKVSEYANTQNKVSSSDFYSNSPLHKEFKAYSKRVLVPQVGGSQIQTHWFYERVRGEYLNEQAYLTQAQKKQFLLQFPKNQLFDKTFLAKVEVAWLQKPEVVSKGAQDSSKIFKKEIDDTLDRDSMAITELYFKNAVSKVILFKFVERLISQASWYNQAYRAQAVAYSLAHFSYLVKKSGKSFNFNKIWQTQAVPKALEDIFQRTAKVIYAYITTPKEGYGNPSQWCKREKCWEDIKALPIELDIPSELLLDSEESTYIKKDEKKTKQLDTGIEVQTFVISQNSKLWKELVNYFENESTLTLTQIEILKKHANGLLGLPSEKQSKVIYELYQQAVNEGFIFNG
jgi:hypothetical protein